KMLSNHEMSLRRISWGMALVGLVTVTGLALTASGGRAARQMSAITEQVEAVDFARLSDLVAQPAHADEPATMQTADAPEAVDAPPAAPAVAQAHHAVPLAPVAPPAPMAPTADMVPPV